ncbi:MAG: TetR/AcrR family transcriptional regulator [Chloroflexota bacterium]
MARTRDIAAHALRRDEILDAAERQIRIGGYDAMSVQALQDELGVSRGAIYHYFGSKEAILGAVLERMTDVAMAVINPIADDPALSALEQLQAVFTTGAQWKAQRSDLLLAVLRSWHAPANDLVRSRAQSAANDAFVPLISRIVGRGVEEGTMNPSSPKDAAVIISALFTGSADVIFNLIDARLDGRVPFEEVQRFIHAYEEAIERILGLPPGSFTLIDTASLHTWFA